MKVPLPTRRATIRLAKTLGPALVAGDLVILKGDLGAGKTFFARALLRSLGVPRNERITSPTFTLVHDFTGSAPLPASVRSGTTESETTTNSGWRVLHVDAYRLRDASEVEGLGLRESRAEGAILLVEWGEPFASALGGDALTIHLAVATTAAASSEPHGAPSQERNAELSASGPRSAELLSALRSASSKKVRAVI